MSSPTALDYTPQTLLPGVAGVDLRRDPEFLEPNVLARMTNVVWGGEGELVGRPGLTEVADTLAGQGISAHTAARLDDPQTGSFVRVWGAGDGLYFGQSGSALTLLETGFSGTPMIAVPWRPNISGKTYLYIADGAKMRKVSFDGGISPLALSAPITATRTELATTLKIAIEDFDDATEWTDNNGGGAASAADDTSDKKEGAACVAFTAGVGSATEGFNCYFAKALDLDLTTYTTPAGSTRAVGNEDNFHLWMHVDKPNFLQEVRIYFVVSDDFDDSVIPGTSATVNKDAYMKSVRANDATSLLELEAAFFAGGEDKVKEVLLSQNLDTTNTATSTTAKAKLQAEQEQASRLKSLFLSPGRGQWTELGIAGRAFRRSSFIRIGNDDKRGWNTVTGIVIAIRTITDESVIVKMDDLYIYGGYGPDTSEVGSVSMDWRHINYHIKTGARSNPSPIQDDADKLDPIRQAVRCFPEVYGDEDVRQRFYRRGGTNGLSAWFLVGQNSADGVCGLDVKTDLEIQLSAQLETDNDQPVTTEDAEGNEVLAQPLNAIWGPYNQHFFGCGDPYRRGFLYWSKYGEPDQWPAANNEDVCSPSEELMIGTVYGGQSYVFSRERGYSISVRVSGNTTVVTVSPTTIGRGVVSRYGLATGREGIYFVARDGVFRTRGQAEEPLAEERLQPLFQGLTRNGYAPINFDQPDRIQLDILGSDLHFIYLDTAGVSQHWVYDIFLNRWRHNNYAQSVQSIACEPRDNVTIIGATAGKFFVTDEAATTDDGEPIVGLLRFGALNQGAVRTRKQYGDLDWELDLAGESVTLSTYLDNGTRQLDDLTVGPGTGRQRYIFDPFSEQIDENKKGHDVTFELAWEATVGRPRIYTAGLTYLPLPLEQSSRVTDWDFGGRGTDKFYKGIELEVDTRGQTIRMDIEVDGEKHETLVVRTEARESLHFSFPQFRGRLVRLHPQVGAAKAEIYRIRWISDEEPLQLPIWQTQFTDHGIPGYHSVNSMFIAWRSTERVCVDIFSRFGQRYEPVADEQHRFFLAATNGEIVRQFFTPPANKGLLHRYVLSSAQAFWLYREETFVLVTPWGSSDPIYAHPFGNDNLDQVRGMADSASLAQRSGGGRLGSDLR